ACAAAILLGPLRRGLLVHMAFWGILTAGARIVHSGEHGIHDALIRAANGGVALVLWMLVVRSHSKRDDLPGASAFFARGTAGFIRRYVASIAAILLALGGVAVHFGVSAQDGS